MAEYKRKELGLRVRTARKHAGLSQTALAEKTGLSVQHISNIENGKTDASISAIVAIANALSVSADHLLCDSLSVPTAALADDISELLRTHSTDDLYVIPKILSAANEIVQSKISRDSNR